MSPGIKLLFLDGIREMFTASQMFELGLDEKNKQGWWKIW